MTVIGENFMNLSSLRVKIEDMDPIIPEFISTNEIRFRTPRFRTHGSKFIEVSNNNYDFTHFSEVYLRAYDSLTIERIVPSIVSTSFHLPLTISGSNFTVDMNGHSYALSQNEVLCVFNATHFSSATSFSQN